MKLSKYCQLFFFAVLFFLALPLLSSHKAYADVGFSRVSSQDPSPATYPVNGLQAVSSYDATHAWAVGSYTNSDGTYHDLIEFWNGTNWTTQTGANPGTDANQLLGVKALSTTDVWAVGSYYTDSEEKVLIEHSTDGGSTWTQDTSSFTGNGSLTGIDGDPSSGDAWAVGWILNDTTSAYEPITLKLVSGHFSVVTL